MTKMKKKANFMKINAYWDDIVIYEITFCRKGEVSKASYERIIVFPMDYTMERIESEVKRRFENEIEVIHISEIFEGLKEKQ
ncbi:hypothetical protein [Carnobacterium gallinarum]|uniref:hypothetical protein n=1 Tax=Carnobacterium gallinarum TaxID=2749 RepID=UPI00146FD429|nr:hypothetical protein [Carnobacterium gallinarum]